MSYNPSIHHRRSIRLKGYDYSSAGNYFITICTQNREHLFGKIEKKQMQLNHAGQMIKKIWIETETQYPNITMDEYIIMPNHFHGIISIIPPVRADSISALDNPITGHNSDLISFYDSDSISAHHIPKSDYIPISVIDNGNGGGVRGEMDSSPTVVETSRLADLPLVVQSFKRHTTIKYIEMVKSGVLPPFDKRIWQRNYWEHVVRNENEYIRISQYINNNPQNWRDDKLNGGIGNVVMESHVPYNEEIWMV